MSAAMSELGVTQRQELCFALYWMSLTVRRYHRELGEMYCKLIQASDKSLLGELIWPDKMTNHIRADQ
jgi:hypothetical protein